MSKIKLKLKLRLRLKPFLFIRNSKVVYEQPEATYAVYELYERVLPFVYKWTGVWTPHKQGAPVDREKLHRIISKYKERGYV